jgi:hypothetical protein
LPIAVSPARERAAKQCLRCAPDLGGPQGAELRFLLSKSSLRLMNDRGPICPKHKIVERALAGGSEVSGGRIGQTRDTRYAQAVRNFLAGICFAASIIWWVG